MFSVQSVLVTISWKILTEFHCFTVHGLKHLSWLIWSTVDLLPSWNSMAWTCISLKFINAKQSGEGLGSLAQLFSFHLNFLWFYIWKMCAAALTFWLYAVWIFSPVVKLHQKQCSSFFVYLLYMCTLLMDWIGIFLWCHIHLSLLELFSCHVEKTACTIMPHTQKKQV